MSGVKHTPGPWVAKSGTTSYPECDDADSWVAVLSPAGKEIVTLHERYASKSDDRGDYDFDADFIAAANPATVLALLAENAALRASIGRHDRQVSGMLRARLAAETRATEAERKLAGADRKIEDLTSALRSLAEGNLGDMAWQANYETIKQVARNAISKEAERG